ncbi:MAG TPA: DUF6600 domain-containing protein [Candidatus Sulfotelmatobacter sp.]|nr:DUF6600 domain-containing protein [Candidatus Sulfotelmatobacter sp.]
MKTHKLWAMVILAALACVLQLSTTAMAQDNDDQDQSLDPPDRVARLNYSQGSISFRPAGEDDWVTAVPNRPMVTGDDLWADENSRAEVHIGSTAIRLGAQTGITFLALDDNTTQIRLAQGSLIVRVRHVDDDDSYEIDTPNIAFTLLQPGEYRVDVSQDGSRTDVTTWHGRGNVTGGGLSYSVLAGQSASFTGNQDHLDYDLSQVPDRDGLDDWALERDEHEDRADSANYVSREMTGYEDLDEYGDWSYVAGYGPCWHPRAVVVGWAPYRYGHWVYVGPWGWTWVEDEPWGFAPFHYGRWAYVSSGWYWVPGPVVIRPVWAPALVAFVGGGPGFHFSAGVGVGWFPLAPGEVYVPGYRVSRTYVNNINITNTTVNVTRVTNVYNTVIVNRNTTVNNITYVNQRVTNGVTVVSHDTFVNARPAAQNLMRVDAREVVAAPVTRAVAVEPVRASVIGAGRVASVRPPATVISRPVVAVRTPPTPVRSIEQRQAIAGGRLNEQAPVRPVGPARPAPQVNQNARPQPNQEGFRPFNQPNSGNSGAENRVKPMLKPQPRVYEQQRSPVEENHNVAPQDNRMSQSSRPPQTDNREFRPPQQGEARPAPQDSPPLVRPAPPVRERTPQQEQQQEQKFNQWHEQRQASPPPQRQQQSRPEPKQEKPPKK